MTSGRLSEREVAAIIARICAGERVAALAAAYGVSPSAIYQRLAKHGLRVTELRPAPTTAAPTGASVGMRVAEAARRLGIRPQAVRDAISRGRLSASRDPRGIQRITPEALAAYQEQRWMRLAPAVSTPRGERNPQHRLSETQVVALRRAYATGTPAEQLAAEYQVSRQHVFRIVSGRAWPQAPGPTVRPRRQRQKPAARDDEEPRRD